MIKFLKKTDWRRVLWMLVGLVFLALGISIFKLSMLGNDPYTGMNLALADVIGIPFAIFQILVNVLIFFVQILSGRELIGLGTIVNSLCISPLVTIFYDCLFRLSGGPDGLFQQILVLLVGMIICSFGISLYQQADMGVSPYDSLSLIMTKKWTKIPYFWHRILTDGVCAIVCFLAGGIVGLGTLVTAFGFGPVVQFFDEHLTKPYLLKK